MRIEVDGVAVTNVTLFVTAWDASKLRDAMNHMVEQPGASLHVGFGVGTHHKDIEVILEDWPA